jgi:hypothetical protein
MAGLHDPSSVIQCAQNDSGHGTRAVQATKEEIMWGWSPPCHTHSVGSKNKMVTDNLGTIQVHDLQTSRKLVETTHILLANASDWGAHRQATYHDQGQGKGGANLRAVSGGGWNEGRQTLSGAVHDDDAIKGHEHAPRGHVHTRTNHMVPGPWGSTSSNFKDKDAAEQGAAEQGAQGRGKH